MSRYQTRLKEEAEKAAKDNTACIEKLCQKHGVEIETLAVILMTLGSLGMGRNTTTIQYLRCLIDVIESPLESLQDIETRIKKEVYGDEARN